MRSEYLEISNDELMKKVRKSKEFRNQVATAHGVTDSNNSFYFLGTCSYPQRYKVTEEQKQAAQAIASRQAKKTYKEHKNDLLFVGMGMVEAESSGEVENCRIRTVVTTKKGEKIFIELQSGKTWNKKDDNYYIICGFCYPIQKIKKGYNDFDYQYNFNDLETETFAKRIVWNKKNILDFVNKELNCDYQNIYIDNYDLFFDYNYNLTVRADLKESYILQENNGIKE